MQDLVERLQRQVERSKRARKQAESLLEEKSKELFLANQQLLKSKEGLEQRVLERTSELVETNQRMKAEIAERLKVERDLQAAIEKAQAAAKAKSEFLANMSHEIRTPMNGVLGMISLIIDSGLDDERHRMAEIVRNSAESLLVILNDVLDFSKIEAGKMDIEQVGFELPKMVHEIAALFSQKAVEKSLLLETMVAEDLPARVVGDPARLRQILTNLVGNAIKFTARGRITLRVCADASDGKEDWIRFEVEDQGIGIPPEKCQSIFEKFTQADSSTTRRFGGTGLGLSISRSLVELMHGDIGVRSVVDRGSTFWFRLPMPADQREQIQAVDTERRNNQKLRKLHILVAEDNMTNQLVTRKMLARLDCSADIACNGYEAIESLRDGDYDLVLMDCMMPECSGYEATAAIRQGQAGSDQVDVPIIAMTANAMVGDREKCLSAGMDDHVSKPVKLEALRDSLLVWQDRRHASLPAQ